MNLAPDELEDRLQVSVFPAVYLNLKDAEDAYAKACEGVGLVIIDALKGATPGADENDSKIRDCIDTLSRVSDKTGTAFLIIHHSGKPKENHSDGRTIPRGSSAIFDACGSVLVMVGEKGLPKQVRHEKGAAEAEGGVIDDFFLAIEDVAIGPDPRAGVRVVYQTQEQAGGMIDDAAARFEKLKKQILATVRKHTDLTSKNAICERVSGTRSTKLSAVQELIEQKKIVEVNGVFRVKN
jgi:RecA-family ATPase